MRINAGSGRWTLDGWVNVDVARDPHAPRDPDIFADIRSIPLPDGCADELMAIHVFEHFYRWEVDALLKEWRRILKPGGKLVLEMPDIMKAAYNLLNNVVGDGRRVERGDQLGMWGIYGDPRAGNPYMCHKWGWTFKTIKPVIAAAGFGQIEEADTQWHRCGRKVRDFRVTARAA